MTNKTVLAAISLMLYSQLSVGEDNERVTIQFTCKNKLMTERDILPINHCIAVGYQNDYSSPGWIFTDNGTINWQDPEFHNLYNTSQSVSSDFELQLAIRNAANNFLTITIFSKEGTKLFEEDFPEDTIANVNLNDYATSVESENTEESSLATDSRPLISWLEENNHLQTYQQAINGDLEAQTSISNILYRPDSSKNYSSPYEWVNSVSDLTIDQVNSFHLGIIYDAVKNDEVSPDILKLAAYSLVTSKGNDRIRSAQYALRAELNLDSTNKCSTCGF